MVDSHVGQGKAHHVKNFPGERPSLPDDPRTWADQNRPSATKIYLQIYRLPHNPLFRAFAFANIEFRIFNGDHAVWFNGMRQPHAAADDAMVADDGVAAQNGCTGVNGDVVF